jgi:hypothetical protein
MDYTLHARRIHAADVARLSGPEPLFQSASQE